MNKEEIDASWKKRLESDNALSDRDIVEDEAILNWIDPGTPGKPTRQIIRELMTLAQNLALDPAVSQDAADLYHEGYLAGKTGAVNRLNEISSGDDEVSF